MNEFSYLFSKLKAVLNGSSGGGGLLRLVIIVQMFPDAFLMEGSGNQ